MSKKIYGSKSRREKEAQEFREKINNQRDRKEEEKKIKELEEEEEKKKLKEKEKEKEKITIDIKEIKDKFKENIL